MGLTAAGGCDSVSDMTITLDIPQAPTDGSGQSFAAGDVQVISGGGSRTQDVTTMSIDPAAAAHIQNLLTDLYSNPAEAVVREYVSNAIDALAGTGGESEWSSDSPPVRVSLPTHLSPVFIVRDSGVGMSADDVRTIYSSYGRSTKRGDYDSIGAFGLGCKSALALTNSFVLSTTKDGWRTTATISRDEDGVGAVKITSETFVGGSEGAGSGTTITIPVNDVASFNVAARKFFEHPLDVDIELDGVLKVRMSADPAYFNVPGVEGLRIGEAATNTYERLVLRIGGLAYSVESRSEFMEHYKHFQGWKRKIYLVDVPIGSIDLTPSREAIRYTQRTIKAIDRLYGSLVNSLKEYFSGAVESAEDRGSAVTAVKTLREHLPNVEIPCWRGEPVETYVRIVDTPVVEYRPGIGSTSRSRTHKIYLDDLDHAVVCLVKPDDTFDRVRNRCLDYFKSMEGTVQAVYLVREETRPVSPWYREHPNLVEVTSTDLIAAAKSYRKANRKVSASGGTRSGITWATMNESGQQAGVAIADLDPEQVYVIVNQDDPLWERLEHTPEIMKLVSKEMGYTFLLLPNSRREDVLRTRLTKAGIPYVSSEVAVKEFLKWYITDEYQEVIDLLASTPYFDRHSRAVARYFNEDPCDDPEVTKQANELVRINDIVSGVTASHIRDLLYTLCTHATDAASEGVGQDRTTDIVPLLRKKYPLYQMMGMSTAPEYLDLLRKYINDMVELERFRSEVGDRVDMVA